MEIEERIDWFWTKVLVSVGVVVFVIAVFLSLW